MTRVLYVTFGNPIAQDPDIHLPGARKMDFDGLEIPKDSSANNPDPSYAFALSRLSSSELDHVPIGVFRDYARPEYSNLVNQQISDEIANHGAGELAALLGSGDTWNVED